MKRSVVFTFVILAALAAIFLLSDELLLLFIVGKIPLTNLTIPPLLALGLWIVIIPAFMLLYRAGSYSFWGAIEVAGEIHQRHLNRRVRWVTEHYAPTHLYAITLLDVSQKLPESSASDPELSLRRRFIALPS